jgi:hypothetical protein
MNFKTRIGHPVRPRPEYLGRQMSINGGKCAAYLKDVTNVTALSNTEGHKRN